MATNTAPMTETERRRLMEEQQRLNEALMAAARAREQAERARAQQQAFQPQSQQQGGMNPLGMLNMMEGGQGGGGGLLSGLFGGSAPGMQTVSGLPSMAMGEGAMALPEGMGLGYSPFGATSAASGAGASGGGLLGGSSGGLGSSIMGAGPWAALAAGILLNENYQGNIGNREGESFPMEYGLTGRALYKDAPGWGEKADEIIPGWGDDIRLAGALSSPVDLFRGDTWSTVWDSLKSGGPLGGLLGL